VAAPGVGVGVGVGVANTPQLMVTETSSTFQLSLAEPPGRLNANFNM
jgi:hypothetical protein